MGGGLLLLGFIPSFLPPAATIPVHGVVQLVSNISRAYFSWRHIRWQVFTPYILGGVVGTACFAFVLKSISLAYLPLFIGGYILLSQWSNIFNRLVAKLESFALLGFIQVGLSLFSGTIGPVHMVLLHKRYDDKDDIVATAAGLMTVKHGLKIVAFIVIGVELWHYLDVMVVMSLAAIGGSYLGTRLRGKTQNKQFRWVLKLLLSVLAIKMIIEVFY